MALRWLRVGCCIPVYPLYAGSFPSIPETMNFVAPENSAKAMPSESGVTIAVANRESGIMRCVMSYGVSDLTAAIGVTIHHHLKDWVPINTPGPFHLSPDGNQD